MPTNTYILHTNIHESVEYIFDHIRKKYVVLTPEEWVRQCCIKMLVEEKKYPIQSISVERKIQIGALKKRYDIIVYKNATPWLLVECKAENVALSTTTLLQSVHYNSVALANYVVLTNGKNTICYNAQTNIWENSLPIF